MLSVLPLQTNLSIYVSSPPSSIPVVGAPKVAAAARRSFVLNRKMLHAEQSWREAEDDSDTSLEDRSSCPKPAVPFSKEVVDLTRSAVVDLVGNPKQKSPM